MKHLTQLYFNLRLISSPRTPPFIPGQERPGTTDSKGLSGQPNPRDKSSLPPHTILTAPTIKIEYFTFKRQIKEKR